MSAPTQENGFVFYANKLADLTTKERNETPLLWNKEGQNKKLCLGKGKYNVHIVKRGEFSPDKQLYNHFSGHLGWTNKYQLAILSD